MILIDGVKFSCIECIRGHRSSRCRHCNRPLLQVRSKGRPNVYANGNPNHRIAVFAEEVASDEEDGTKGDSGSGCHGNPVVILKASLKQVMDLTDGLIIGPYDQTKANINSSSRPPPPVVSSESFINSTSCCSGLKLKTDCGCAHNNSKKTINKSRILKTYLKNRMIQNRQAEDTQWTFIDHSQEIKKKSPEIKREPNNENEKFCVFSIPSCSIPGSCGCDSNCTCAGCTVHGNVNSATNEINELLSNEILSTKYDPYDNITANNRSIFNGHDNEMNELSVYPHKLFDNIPYSKASANPEFLASGEVEVPKLENGDFSNFNACQCHPENCECSNCETHGIINGLKLDDFFSSAFDSTVSAQLENHSSFRN
ncbi:uncharacterized protein PRCAT00003341001 [Priceomyces carsonii]|uniref:uncharacterized protein n=1 Tax=Priceomyces carsonii TaxID=28549 RepID=UPI002EDB4D2D|nr:unnamed protein product [Priceomyces carsonii]